MTNSLTETMIHRNSAGKLVTQKEKEREELAGHVEEYLANGGAIETIEDGEMSHNFTDPLYKQFIERAEKAKVRRGFNVDK